jgi:hypothetical protein
MALCGAFDGRAQICILNFACKNDTAAIRCQENFEGERHSFQGTGFDELTKSRKVFLPSFRRKPESRFFEHLQNRWTPVSTRVMTS